MLFPHVGLGHATVADVRRTHLYKNHFVSNPENNNKERNSVIWILEKCLQSTLGGFSLGFLVLECLIIAFSNYLFVEKELPVTSTEDDC